MVVDTTGRSKFAKVASFSSSPALQLPQCLQSFDHHTEFGLERVCLDQKEEILSASKGPGTLNGVVKL